MKNKIYCKNFECVFNDNEECLKKFVIISTKECECFLSKDMSNDEIQERIKKAYIAYSDNH